MPKFALSDMEYDEVSFVKRGADQDAKILIAKRDFNAEQRRNADKSGDAMPGGRFPIKNQEDLNNAVKLMGQADDKDAVKSHIMAMAKKHKLSLPDSWMSKNMDPGDMHKDTPMGMMDCPECGKKMKKSDRKCPHCGYDNVQKTLEEWGFAEVGVNKTTAEIYDASLELAKSIVEVVSKSGSKADIGKVVKDVASKIAGETDAWLASGVEKTDGDLDSAVLGRLTAGRDLLDSVVGKKDVPESDKVDKKDDDILKSLPDNVRKHFEDLKKSADDANAIAKAAQEAVAKAEEQKRVDEWISKARDWKYIPGTPEEIGKSIRAAERSLSADEFSALLKTFEATTVVAKQSNLFGEKGRTGDGASDSGSKINKAVEELRKSDTNLSEAKAYEKVLQDNPSLYDEYLKEAGGNR